MFWVLEKLLEKLRREVLMQRRMLGEMVQKTMVQKITVLRLKTDLKKSWKTRETKTLPHEGQLAFKCYRKRRNKNTVLCLITS